MRHRLPNKPNFIEHLNNSLSESNTSITQECYLIGDFDVNLLSGNKMLLKKQYFDSSNKASPIVKIYKSLLFSLSPSINYMEPQQRQQSILKYLQTMF